MPTGHPLAAERSVRLPQLADADWISGSARPEGTLLDAALRHGFRPRVAHVVAEWTAKLGYVAAGLGVTLVPAPAAGTVRPDVVLLPVRDEGAPARAVYAGAVPGSGHGGVPGRAAGGRGTDSGVTPEARRTGPATPRTLSLPRARGPRRSLVMAYVPSVTRYCGRPEAPHGDGRHELP
ncbi:LysR substrate-binding domain-containing protein [Streptomyces sp. NPDC006875]|uniref:LysR substrate-binding domain-containing protein n=1 Tax=Streptomyces sp. NPDC006875 TaxID=3154781 RepID=UPI0033C97066